MSSNTVFTSNQAIGAIGEAKVQDFYFRIKKEILTDVRDDKSYHKIDVDFIDARGTKIEVKSDANPEKSILIETVENKRCGTPGWIYKTQADLIYFAKPDYLLQLDARILRNVTHRVTSKHIAQYITPQLYPNTQSIRLTYHNLAITGALMHIYSCDAHGNWWEHLFCNFLLDIGSDTSCANQPSTSDT